MPEATAKNLSDFQITKFTYMFNAFFDLEQVIRIVKYFQTTRYRLYDVTSFYSFSLKLLLQNGLIEHDDIMAFGERMTKYTGWAKDNVQYKKMIDILETFYECVKDQVKAEYLSKYNSSPTNLYPCESLNQR